ncbi:hypothetical protein SLA2020_035390 [Shorea laevis]
MTMHRLIFRRFESTFNARVKDMVSKQLCAQTLALYKEELHSSGVHADATVLPSLIKACSSPQTHFVGLQLHSIVIKSGSDSDLAVPNSLISMYAKSMYIDSACKLFDEMPERDTITYNTLIKCYSENGCLSEAMELLKEMYRQGFVPKPELIAKVIWLCTHTGDIKLGRAIHGLVIVDGRVESSIYLSTALVDFYMKSNESLVASRVFCLMESKPEVVSWTAMISGCISNRKYEMGIHYLRRMLSQGQKPNRVTLLGILPAFGELGNVKCGKEIHGYAIRHGYDDSGHHLADALIEFYGRCGKRRYARIIFKQSRVKDVVMWSSIIGIHVRGGVQGETMKLFRLMRVEGIEPNSVTLLAMISCCSSLASLSHGQAIHTYVVKYGFNSDLYIGNALIDMYSKCGCLKASHQIFNEMGVKDPVSWSSLISGYGIHGHGEEALQLFDEMRERKIEVDGITWLAVLSACNHSGLVEEGEKLFKHAVEVDAIGVEHYACYVDLLGRSGKVEKACDMVRKMPVKPSEKIWSSLVSACKVHGKFELAERLVDEMIKSEPENPANYTLLSMIRAESGNWVKAEEVRRLMRIQELGKRSGFSKIEVESELARGM